MELTKEQKLVLLGSRLTFSEQEKMEIKGILECRNIAWNEVFKIAIYHKTLPLCISNYLKISPDAHIPEYLYMIEQFIEEGNEKRGQSFSIEMAKLQEACETEGFSILPVKGTYLMPLLYRDSGVRYQGDSDFLVKKADIVKLEKVLKENGYTQGWYYRSDGSIHPLSRIQEIKWKLYMSHLPPFVKTFEVSNRWLKYIKLDFRYALTDDLNTTAVDYIVDEYHKTKQIDPVHMIIHMCTHFYDEAYHADATYLGKHINLIKLCDLREYILLQKSPRETMECVRLFAEKFSLRQQVYFTMCYLYLLYRDGYEQEILETWEEMDDSILTTIRTKSNKEIKIDDLWVHVFGFDTNSVHING